MLPAGAATVSSPDLAVAPASDWSQCGCCESRSFLGSDRAFDGFIGPITNPIYAKDPRSLSEARFLFINNIIPADHPLGGGNFQAYALQVRVALTERLTLIADKDGYATIHPRAGGDLDGWLNLAAGLKYTLLRDVERQRLLAVGFMYEVPTGEAEVFQNNGSGILTLFASGGQEFATDWHLIGNTGLNIPTNARDNSGQYYLSLHLDRRCLGWLYPLAEVNWFYYYSGGDRGIPPALGEGDGLINFGTTGIAGASLVTGAVGLKAVVNDHLSVGAAWEVPLSNRNDLIDNRLTFECILRY